MSVLSPVPDLARGCEIPALTQQLLPATAFLTEAGFVFAVIVAITCAVSFRLAGSEVVRYRVLSIAISTCWAALALGILGVCLALWVLPGVKCGL